VKTDQLFDIDVAAEVATLCGAQLQGPWQVPAELVRLASARGATGVEIRRSRGGLELEVDELVTTRDELTDLATVLDDQARPRHRQDAIARLEAGGGTALLWATGIAGSRFELTCRAVGVRWGIEVRRGRARLTGSDDRSGVATGTMMWWRGAGRSNRPAIRWLETALRFLPIPVELDHRPLERGLPDGLFRMRVAEPLAAELVVTAGGDMPALWLLNHGVLSARAVVPGYPAFSAAIEMHGVAAPEAGPDELRSMANPFLPRLIDQAVTMLVLLAERLPAVDEPVRRRLTTLLLRSAELDLQRQRVMGLEIVPVRSGRTRRMISPTELAAIAADRGGVLRSTDPGPSSPPPGVGPIVEASAEERRLLRALLGIRFEHHGGERAPSEPVPRLLGALRRGGSRLRGLLGHRPLDDRALSTDEHCFVAAAARSGLDVGFVAGDGPIRRRGARLELARHADRVVHSVQAVASDEIWLYPALLAIGADETEIPDSLRIRWIEALSS